MITTAFFPILGVVLLVHEGKTEEALCYDHSKEYLRMSLGKVFDDCEKDPAIKGRPVPFVECAFKALVDPEGQKINFQLVQTLVGVFATDAKLAFLTSQHENCKMKVNSDETAIAPYFQCLADILKKCKDFEGHFSE